MSGDRALSNTSRPRRARKLFPFLAVVIGLLPLLAVEIACRVLQPSDSSDQLASFESVRPLFELDGSGQQMAIAENRLTYFRPAQFLAEKTSDERRVFCLGGSTVQGRPYATETSVTSWLEIDLNAASDSETWRVINCGGVSYASYRLTPILQEVLQYQPDLIVVMSGHNEFLEDRELAMAQRARSRLRSAELIRNLFASPEPLQPRAILPEEVDALLDYKGGLEAYTLDFEWRSRVVEQYRRHLEAMISLCRDAGVPLVFVTPVGNLRDIPPFKTEHDPRLTDVQLREWNIAWANARSALEGNPSNVERAAEFYAQACEIDPSYAGAWFELGRCYDALRDFDRAAESYLHARDVDVCPLRMTTALAAQLRSVTTEFDVPLVDFAGRVMSESRDGITDSQWMLDHVHPTIAGHQLLADEIVDWMIASNSFEIASRAQWADESADLRDKHLQELPANYFTEGAKRLESLNRWARGRGDKIRETANAPADRSNTTE